jgi:hypothetical protein
MKHEYLLSNSMGDKLLKSLRELYSILNPGQDLAIAQAWYLSVGDEKFARIVDELVDNERAWKLNLIAPEMTASVEMGVLPEQVEERVIRIPKEPADPEPASRSNGHKPQKMTVSVETEPRFCAVCGDPVRGRRKVCEKDECIREMQRRYVRESAARKRAQKKAEEAEKEPAQEVSATPFEEPISVTPVWPTGTTWLSKSGILSGTYLAAWEMGDAIRDGKFEVGDLVEHKVRGEHIAVQEKDHLKFVQISTGRSEGA